MKKSNTIVKYFLTGTLFFVVPTLIVIVLLSKALHLLMPITHKITESLELKSIFGSAAIIIVGLGIVMFLGLLFGYFLLNGFLKLGSNKNEERFFYYLPSFQIMKYRFIEEDVYRKQKFWEPILLKEETFYLVAFITDRSHPDLIAVYVPDAPKMDAGEVRYFDKDRIEYIAITMKEAMNGLHHFGKGITFEVPKS